MISKSVSFLCHEIGMHEHRGSGMWTNKFKYIRHSGAISDVNPSAGTIWPFIPREAAPWDVLTDDGWACTPRIYQPVEEIPEGVEDRILC